MRFIFLVRDCITLFPKLSFILFCNRIYVACILFTSKIEGKSWTFQSLISISGRMLKRLALLFETFWSPPQNVFELFLTFFALFPQMFLHSSSKCFALLLNVFALLLFGARWLRHNWRLEISNPTFILWTHPTPKRNHLSDVSPFYSLYAFSSIFFHFIQFYPIWRYPIPLLSSALIPLQRATTYLM